METKLAGVFVAMVLGIAFIRHWRVYKWGKCTCKKSLKGKTVIITGANSGIGKATAKELAKRDARVIMACRDSGRAREAVMDIRRITSRGELVIKHLDLASLNSVRRFVDDFTKSEERLDILINNAGVFQCPFMKTEDGFEMQMGVNHLGHFLLTVLLIDILKRTSESRILIVTSSLYKQGVIEFDNLNSERHYDKKAAYNNSKLANVLFAHELYNRFHSSGIGVYTISPGHVWTNLGRHLKLPWLKLTMLLPLAILFIRTPNQGCQTVLHCALMNDENSSGKYYRNCKEEPLFEDVIDEKISRRLWDKSSALTGIKGST